MHSLYDNEMKLEFLSKSNNEAFARVTVAAFATQLDPSIEELADIKTAVSEAIRMSVIIDRQKPPPMAGPLMAEMTG